MSRIRLDGEEQLRRIVMARGLVTKDGTLLPGGTDKVA